jgi:TonB family protein
MDTAGPGVEGQRIGVGAGRTGDVVYRAGTAGVSWPLALQKVKPGYSVAAQNAKLSGTVVLEVVVSAEGKFVDARVTTSLGPGLDEKAIEAVKTVEVPAGHKRRQARHRGRSGGSQLPR